jgi:hypothetical protein
LRDIRKETRTLRCEATLIFLDLKIRRHHKNKRDTSSQSNHHCHRRLTYTTSYAYPYQICFSSSQSAVMLSRSAGNTFKPLLRKTAPRSLGTQASSQRSNGRWSSSKSWKLEAAMALGLSAVTATTITLMDAQHQKKSKQESLKSPHYPLPDAMITSESIADKPRLNTPPPRPDLPIYTREDVAEHCDEDSLWYTFRGERFFGGRRRTSRRKKLRAAEA